MPSCSSNDDEVESLVVTPTEISVTAAGENFTLITIANVDVSVSSSSTWLQLTDSNILTSSKNSEKTEFSFTAEANTSGNSRTATITVKGVTMSELVTVTQEGLQLSVSASDVTIAPNTEEFTISVEADIDFDVTVSDGSDWLKVKSAASGLILFSVETNESTSARTATVTVSEGDLTCTITVIQEGVSLEVSPQEVTVEAVGAMFELNVNANTDYTVTTTADWITLTSDDGTGNLTFTVAANSSSEARTGRIILTAGELSQTVEVTQGEAILKVEPESVSLDINGGSFTIVVTSNTTYTTTVSEEWLSLTSDEDGALTFTAGANESSTRSATITISTGEIVQTVNVTQEGITLELSAYTANFEASGGTITISVETNYTYSTSLSADWLTVTTANTNELVISAEQNPYSTQRTATITLTVSDLTRTVTVTQDAVTLSVPVVRCTFTANTHTHNFVVTSNVECTVVCNEDWITINGLSNSTLSFTVDANPSAESRTGSIVITAGDLTHTTTIIQAGVTIDAPSTVSMEADGGSFSAVLNRPYSSVSNIPDWITFTSEGSSVGRFTYTFTVAENTGDSERTASIIIQAGDVSKTITVTQEAEATLTVTASSTSVGVEGGRVVLSITSASSFSATSSASWLTQSSNSQTKLIFTAAANTTSSSRSATITVTNSTTSRTVTVTQSGITLTIDNTSVQATGDSYTFTVKVTSNVDFSFNQPCDWMNFSSTSVIQTYTSGDDTIKVTSITFNVDTNTSSSSRSAELVFSAGDVSATLTVTQPGIYISVGESSVSVGSTGGSFSITVTSNVQYSFTLSDSWISNTSSTLSEAYYSGGDVVYVMTYSFEAEANTSSSSRTASITFQTGNVSQTVTVSQSAG